MRNTTKTDHMIYEWWWLTTIKFLSGYTTATLNNCRNWHGPSCNYNSPSKKSFNIYLVRDREQDRRTLFMLWGNIINDKFIIYKIESVCGMFGMYLYCYWKFWYKHTTTKNAHTLDVIIASPHRHYCLLLTLTHYYRILR